MFELFDETFEIEKTNDYNLSIQVSLGGFSFSVINPKNNQLLVLKQKPVKISSYKFLTRRLTEWMETENILQNSFQQTRLIVCTEHYFLIPEHLYLENYKQTLFQTLLNCEPTLKTEENQLENTGARLLFGLPSQLETVFGEINSGFSMVHPVTLLAENAPKTQNNYRLVLFLEHTFAYILIFNPHKLLHSNRFQINHPNDLIYFLLNLLDKLQIKQSQLDLFAAGAIDNQSGISLKVKEFFPDFKYLNYTFQQINTDLIEKQDFHKFVPLLLV